MHIHRLLCLIFAFLIASISYAEEQLPPGYAVASAHPLATAAGLEILASGGNAFDAAVAMSAALAVVEPYHSGLGGGGFWLLHDAKTKKNIVVDGREVAPIGSTEDMFLDKQGQPIPGLSLNGGLAAGIPGEPAALVYIAEHYGQLPLAKSLAPAIRLAEEGFPVDPQLLHFLTMGDRAIQLKKFKASADIYFPNGRFLQLGEILRQPDLANTLKVLAAKGHDGFYKGKIAALLVNANQQAGGIWRLEDLSSYHIVLREPLVGAYHQMLIITTPPPSEGGVILLLALNILQCFNLADFSTIDWIHHVVEAMRLSYWQANAHVGDPDFVSIDVEALTSQAHAKQLQALIKPNEAMLSATLPAVDMPNTGSNTTHLVVLDAQGNRVAATMTVNYIFGSSVIAAGTGVLLNDGMDDFSIKPGEQNVYGVVGQAANTIKPGKRPVSNMTPTFLETPTRLALLGTPGGSRIPSMVLLGSLSFFSGGGAISMVSTMRFHHQYLPDVLQFEPATFTPIIQQKLQGMGYKLMALKEYYGDMQAITWEKDLNVLTATSDPRRIGMGTVVTLENKEGYGFKH